MLTRMLGLDSDERKQVFSDVDGSAWYACAVNAAYRAGLITGYFLRTAISLRFEFVYRANGLEIIRMSGLNRRELTFR